MVMLDSDWEGLLETALLHSRLWHGGLKPSELAALSQQISRRVASYGATYEDRLKLRLHIKTDQYVLLEDIQIDKQAESAIDYVERLLKKASSKKE
jgi:hypothetical protein